MQTETVTPAHAGFDASRLFPAAAPPREHSSSTHLPVRALRAKQLLYLRGHGRRCGRGANGRRTRADDSALGPASRKQPLPHAYAQRYIAVPSDTLTVAGPRRLDPPSGRRTGFRFNPMIRCSMETRKRDDCTGIPACYASGIGNSTDGAHEGSPCRSPRRRRAAASRAHLGNRTSGSCCTPPGSTCRHDSNRTGRSFC